jgi:2-polyprenyl-3-methyl-5-hydroxy-6-metoxy-1,4-benzoquinol methylase
MQDTRAPSDPALSVAQYYQDSPLSDRLLVQLRPYICPFAPMVKWVQPGSSVLDLGCGGGLWLLTLADSGCLARGVGCDINHRALIQGRRAAERFTRKEGAGQIDFLHTRGIDEWPTDLFDVVSLIDVLHHVPPKIQADFLRRALERVKPGGKLIYKDMASAPSWISWGNRLHDLVLARQWIHYFPIERAAEVLTKAGGSVRHRQNWRRLFYGHELLVVDK